MPRRAAARARSPSPPARSATSEPGTAAARHAPLPELVPTRPRVGPPAPATTRQRLERAFAPEKNAEPAEAPAKAEETAAAAAPVQAAVEAPKVEPPQAETLADVADEQSAAAESDKAAAEGKKEEAPAKAEEAEAEEGGAEAKAPASPQQDPAFRRVLRRVKAVAAQQAHNNAAQRKAAEAQAAAAGPPNEIASQAAGQQVARMSAQEPQPFDRAGFKQKLLAKVREIAPQSVEDIEAFESSGKTAELKEGLNAEVGATKEAAQGPIATAAAEEPSTAGTQPKPVTPQPPTEPGPPPPEVGAQGAAPKPKTEAEVSLDSSVEEVDRKWEENDLNEDKLRKAGEPGFEEAITAKNDVAANAEAAPLAYREQEAGVLARAQDQAAGTAEQGTGSMFDTRSAQFDQVSGEQDATRTADEQKRAEVSGHIETIYNTTKSAVEVRLGQLDTDVATTFDGGADTARINFDNNVASKRDAWEAEHPVLAVAEKLGWPVDLERLYNEARDDYVQEMDGVIDQVAGVVETGLNEAKNLINDGRLEVETYVQSLPDDLRKFGEDAASTIQTKFDALQTEVEQHQDKLIDALAEKYVARLEEVNKAIDDMKAADRGWVGRAIDQASAIVEIYEKVRALLARFADIVDAILDDPGAFFNNLIAGIQAGLSQFIGNILDHLKKGLMEWLFGAIASAGITIPESFDLKSIIQLVLQVLGLTYANFRARAVRLVGEPIVAAMETAVEIFRVVLTEGIGGLWRWLEGMVGDLKTMILDGIIAWVKEKIIIAGITWIIGLLNPVGGLIKIANAIIKIVDFFLTRGAQIAALANAVLGALSAIVGGAIGTMASAIENALARAIPVTIGFLAALAGIGGVSEMIREQIARAQAPVNDGIDRVIGLAVNLAKKIGGVFGKKKKEDEKDQPPETADPEHDAKLAAGLAAIDQEEAKHLEAGKIEREEAEKVAAAVKAKHPIFRALTVVEGAGTWDYRYVGSEGTKKGEGQEESEEIFEIGDKIMARPSFRPSTKEAVPITSGEDRRHIEAWQVLHERLRRALTGKTLKLAAAILERSGYKPAAVTKEGILEAARNYLRDQFNAEENLWAGPSKENQDKGRQFAQAKTRADKALIAGDKGAFEAALAELEALWRDPDPTAVKEGFRNVTKMTVRLMRKEFRERWPAL
ncbi:MAG TPA: hypothetical protein VN493_19495 [Thermoanaerobaculia bacterium]|nr:hypothetical protein [Thermoanaerobaculia bacterium]